MRSWMYLMAALVCACAIPALPQTSHKPPASSHKKSAFDKAVLEEYVRNLFIWPAQVQVSVGDPKPSQIPGFQQIIVTATYGKAAQQEIFHVSKDGQKIVRGSVYDVNESPFQAELTKLNSGGHPSFGPADAPVTVAIFSDFQCSFCKEEAKVIRQNLASTYPKEVRVLFNDFPLEQIHPWAKPAAVAGRCIFKQSPQAFWDYHDWMFEHQSEINPENLKEKVFEFAKTKGVEPLQLTACIDSKPVPQEIEDSITEGKSLQIASTPTLFVNGRKLEGALQWAQLRQVIDHEIEYQKAHADPEKCCEIKLPSPLSK